MSKNLLVLATAGLLLAGAAFADDVKAVTPDNAKDAMMADMMKYANPGPQHAILKAMVGTWNATTKSWAGGAEPTVNKGVMKNEMTLGGRYLESKYKGTYDGKPFEGYGLTGYDTKRDQLISLWMDSMSTSWSAMSGAISADGKEMTSSGTMDGTDGKPMPVRTVTRIESPSKHVFTMYGSFNGQEMPMMEITYDLATNKK
jgi:hypothetical protein